MQADLPARLGVDLAHCERQAQRVVESSSAMLQIIQSELMTDAYFDGIAAEVGDLLEVRQGLQWRATVSGLARHCQPSELTVNLSFCVQRRKIFNESCIRSWP